VSSWAAADPPRYRSGPATDILGIQRKSIKAEAQLTLTDEERAFLAGLLEATLKDTRVEEHRTPTLSYREHILHKEDLIAALLSKLGRRPE
jgi:hypothetical protein